MSLSGFCFISISISMRSFLLLPDFMRSVIVSQKTLRRNLVGSSPKNFKPTKLTIFGTKNIASISYARIMLNRNSILLFLQNSAFGSLNEFTSSPKAVLAIKSVVNLMANSFSSIVFPLPVNNIISRFHSFSYKFIYIFSDISHIYLLLRLNINIML